jgi:hypothetical protein
MPCSAIPTVLALRTLLKSGRTQIAGLKTEHPWVKWESLSDAVQVLLGNFVLASYRGWLAAPLDHPSLAGFQYFQGDPTDIVIVIGTGKTGNWSAFAGASIEPTTITTNFDLQVGGIATVKFGADITSSSGGTYTLHYGHTHLDDRLAPPITDYKFGTFPRCGQAKCNTKETAPEDQTVLLELMKIRQRGYMKDVFLLADVNVPKPVKTKKGMWRVFESSHRTVASMRRLLLFSRRAGTEGPNFPPDNTSISPSDVPGDQGSDSPGPDDIEVDSEPSNPDTDNSDHDVSDSNDSDDADAPGEDGSDPDNSGAPDEDDSDPDPGAPDPDVPDDSNKPSPLYPIPDNPWANTGGCFILAIDSPRSTDYVSAPVSQSSSK